MVELVRDRIDMFVVGRALSSTAVGIYAIGEEVAFLPGTEIVLPLCRACFPAFSALRRNGEGVDKTFMRPIAATFLLTFPAGLGLSLVADPLARLLIGQQWTGAILIIQLLGFASAMMVFGLVAASLMSAHALMRQQFTITVVSLIVRLLLLLVLVAKIGIAGAAIGALCGMLTEHLLLLIFTFRRFGFSLVQLVLLTWRVLAAGAAMAVVLVATGLGWKSVTADAPQLISTLAMAVSLGAAVYAGVLLILWEFSGRPEGAEADLRGILLRVARRFILWRRKSPKTI